MDRDKTQKIVMNVAALVAATLLPGFVFAIAGWSSAAGTAALTAMSVYIAAMFGGQKIAAALVLPLAIAAGLAVWWSHSPWLAALLMFVVAGVRGVMAQYGFHGPLIMAVITVAFIVSEPPRPEVGIPDPLFTALVVCAVGVYVLLVLAALKRWMPKPTLTKIPAFRANLFGVLLGLSVAVAAWVTVDRNLGHEGAWIMLTIVVVLMPYGKDGFTKALSRAVGTTIGFLIAIGLANTVAATWVLYVIGAAAMVAALAFLRLGKPYWQYAAILTVGIVILEGSSTSIIATADTRIHATLIGAAVALLVTALMVPMEHVMAKRTA